MVTICLANNKGGVGKSTSALNIGLALHTLGYRVLLVDCDAQCNLTMAFKGAISLTPNLGTLLEPNSSVTVAAAIHQLGEGLALLPSSLDVNLLEQYYGTQKGSEFLLRKGLGPVSRHYDFCIIDTPPHMSALLYAALVASNWVFIPVQPERWGYQGLKTLLDACDRTRDYYNPELQLGGIFFTKYAASYRSRLHRDFVQQTRDRFGDADVLQVSIRTNLALAEAVSLETSIFEYAPDSHGAQDYMELTQAILHRVAATHEH